MASTNPEFNRTDTPSFGGLSLTGPLAMLAGAVQAGVSVPVYAATIALDPTKASVFVITTTAAVGASTLNLASVPVAGTILYLVLNNDATLARTITFGTNFRMTAATIVGTAAKVMVVTCVSDGTNAIEVSRTAAIT